MHKGLIIKVVFLCMFFICLKFMKHKKFYKKHFTLFEVFKSNLFQLKTTKSNLQYLNKRFKTIKKIL